MTKPAIKSESSDETIATVAAIEAAADRCYQGSSIFTFPANLAIWSLLTHVIIDHTESESTKLRSTLHSYTGLILNAALAVPRAISWIRSHGRPPTRLLPLRLSPNLHRAAKEAFQTAHNYQAFCVCLPMWHKDRYAVELLSGAHARFVVPGGSRQKQVSAYQKGYRPTIGEHASSPKNLAPRTAELDRLVGVVLERAKADHRGGFSYGEPRELWRHMQPAYREGVNDQARRPASLQLNAYNMGDFNLFFAALDTVAAAHDFLCFAWGKQTGHYPYNSAVVVKPAFEWSRILGWLSGLSSPITEAILADLTLSSERAGDLLLQPFVPLDAASRVLALAPPFPLKARPDENILRILTLSNRRAFDDTTLMKEGGLRDRVKEICPQFDPQGPRTLPRPLPDIDLLLKDEISSTLVICEAKWIRSALRSVEHVDRDRDVTKGFDQLAKIRDYLSAHPRHLFQLRTLPRPMNEYENVYYILLARDHWLWRDPDDNVAIIEFDAFTRVLATARDLHAAMAELVRYDWLPVEGRDFDVRMESARAGGAMLESEIFYALRERPS